MLIRKVNTNDVRLPVLAFLLPFRSSIDFPDFVFSRHVYETQVLSFPCLRFVQNFLMCGVEVHDIFIIVLKNHIPVASESAADNRQLFITNLVLLDV